MTNLLPYIVVIIILVFAVNAAIVWSTNKAVQTLFDGFYSADPVFCDESGLDMMVLYFDHGDGYIMIKTESDAILLNSTFEYRLSNVSGYALSINSPQIYQITFYNIEDQDFFPTQQMVEFIPTTQRIKLFNREDEQIYGILYKNNAATDMKQLLGAQDYLDNGAEGASADATSSNLNDGKNTKTANIDDEYSSDEE